MTYQPKVYRLQGGNVFKVVTGGYIQEYVETISTSADVLTSAGHSNVAGTTAGPTYLISNPITGVRKSISLNASSSGATHRAIIACASTGVSFDTTGQNQITLATSAIRGVSLMGASTTAWRVVGTYVNTMLGLGNVST